MNLEKLKNLFSDQGCNILYFKVLAPNDNSKNQIYLGGNFEIINILPIKEITNDPAGNWERERFKAKIEFLWLGDDGQLRPAPNTQLILYPKYPEVRLSGFLLGCRNAPSELMTSRLAGRILFLGVSKSGSVLGYVVSPGSEIANEISKYSHIKSVGVFGSIELAKASDSRLKLLEELHRVHSLDWIKSKRLDSKGNPVSCQSPNCGGYTLEAELGITPNGYSEPDYLGWEIKQFNVPNFNRILRSVITLMTPEPTQGYYANEGVEAFIRKYGYADLKGRPDRLNFGGIHKYGITQERTKLRLELIGYDPIERKIASSAGRIALIDIADNEASSWSFSSLLMHWNKKHNQACYIPSMSRKNGARYYKYGSRLILGTGTDFHLFLDQIAQGHIYYDPGIKLENASSSPTTKRRSQFRIKSEYLKNLYHKSELVEIL